MKKLFKWLLGLVMVLAVLLVLAVILLPLVFDPNEHKPRIQQLAAESIGREVELRGPIEWSVFPWIAINLNDVSVANEGGFKGDHLASIEQVAVRVKLLPLLRKQIQIGQVELKQPSINLQVARSGQSNWQSITDHLAQDTAETAVEDSSTDLEIRGISVRQGRLDYTDASADLQMVMTELSFDSTAIKADQASDMSLQASIELPAQALKGQLNTAWQAQGLTGDQGMLMDFDKLSFAGFSDQVPLKLQAVGKTVLNLAQDSLKAETLQLSYGAMELSTPISGQQLSGSMALQGQLQLAEFSLADLLTDMGSPLQNQADNQLSGSMNWSLVNDRLQLQDMLLQLDDTEVKGQFDIKRLSQLQGEFSLNIDQIDLDQYLPASDEGAAQATSGTTDTGMDLGQLHGQIKMGALQVAGVNMSDITLDIKTRGENLTIEPLQAGFYQGLIKTELQLQPGRSNEKLTVTHRMQDFQAGSLLTDLMGTDYLTGLGQLNADIKVAEPFSEHPLKTASGNVSYRLTDGDIVGIDVFQIIQQSLSLLNKQDALSNSADLKTAFGLMEIQADINNGVLTTNTLKLNSPFFDLSGQVTIDLDQQTIKGTIKPVLTNIPEGVLDKNFEKLLNVRIPVSLDGNLLAPSIKIDIEKLILESQKAKIDEKKEELKEDLLDALLGSKKDTDENPQDPDQPPTMTEEERKRAEKDQLKRDLLEGLFKKSKDKSDKDDTDTGEGDQ